MLHFQLKYMRNGESMTSASLKSRKVTGILKSKEQVQIGETAVKAAQWLDSFISTLPEECAKEKEMLFESAVIVFPYGDQHNPPSVRFYLNQMRASADADLTALSECLRKLCQAAIGSDIIIEEIHSLENVGGVPYSPNIQSFDIPLDRTTIEKMRAATCTDEPSVTSGAIDKMLDEAKQSKTHEANRIFDDACGQLKSLVTLGCFSQEELDSKLQERFGLGGTQRGSNSK